MITTLAIENFKSVKSLTLDCRRVNVFIGEPNTGKSNLLEALGLLSWCGLRNAALKDFVRLQHTQNLFYDDLLDEPIGIRAAGAAGVALTVRFEGEHFLLREDGNTEEFALLRHTGENMALGAPPPGTQALKFYAFKELSQFPGVAAANLAPPHGDNLFSLAYGTRRFRDLMQDFFKPYGLAVVLKPQEKRFEVQKQADGVAVNYPYALTAETLRRAIFYAAATASNKDAILVFDVPEAHMSPQCTKQLGARIALDGNNQYFIATHSPCLLKAIMEKGKRDELNVALASCRDYRTQVRCLT
ncbi:MAG: AAA family ATPase, partial [Planctomycetota bacterium]